jgi:hypothetical protein
MQQQQQVPVQLAATVDGADSTPEGARLYITLHYITLHYITLHYITLHATLERRVGPPIRSQRL